MLVCTNNTQHWTGDDPNREIVMLSPKPHSSISIFGKGVVANYGNNFGLSTKIVCFLFKIPNVAISFDGVLLL